MNTPENNKQPTYKRQRFLLAFIRQLQEGITITELQKLVFLHTMSEESDYYEFVPYKYGAYSFNLNEDLEILQRDGYLLIEAVKKSKKITAINYNTEKSNLNIASERGDDLNRKAYRKYPFYTINSEILDRLFTGGELAKFNQRKQLFYNSENFLFTIGYEGKSIEAFINTLIANDIHLLCDIRKNPISRKFGFSKNKLKHVLETINIEYAHLPELGIATDKRATLNTKEDYNSLFAEYAKTLHYMVKPLEQLNSFIDTHSRIALMCYEQDVNICHRHVVRDFIIKNSAVRSADL